MAASVALPQLLAVKEVQQATELQNLLTQYPEVHLFLGFGSSAQYEDIDAALLALKPHILKIQERVQPVQSTWLAVYGGDRPCEDAPDIGWLTARLKQQAWCACHVLSVQTTATPPVAHADFVTHYTPQRDPGGQVVYGGVREGKPVGGTAVYLAPPMLDRLTCVWALGGGAVACEELALASALHVPWVFLPCRARNPAAYGCPWGPVHAWAALQGAVQLPSSPVATCSK